VALGALGRRAPERQRKMLLEVLSAVRDRSKVLCCRGTVKCAGATACPVVGASYGVAVLLAVW
jgi:hypothetical protein